MLLSSADFFNINFFKKFFKEHKQSVKKLDHILILVQTVCRGYQETTKVAASKEKVKTGACHLIFACWVIFLFFKKKFRNITSVSNSLDPDQAQGVQTVCKG